MRMAHRGFWCVRSGGLAAITTSGKKIYRAVRSFFRDVFARRVEDIGEQPLITYPRASGIGLYCHTMELCAQAGFRPLGVRDVAEPTTIDFCRLRRQTTGA